MLSFPNNHQRTHFSTICLFVFYYNNKVGAAWVVVVVGVLVSSKNFLKHGEVLQHEFIERKQVFRQCCC